MKRYLLFILIALALFGVAITLSAHTALAHGDVIDEHADTGADQASSSNQRVVVGIILGVIVVGLAVFFITKKSKDKVSDAPECASVTSDSVFSTKWSTSDVDHLCSAHAVALFCWMC